MAKAKVSVVGTREEERMEMRPEGDRAHKVFTRIEKIKKEMGKHFLELGLLLSEVQDNKWWARVGYGSLSEYIQDELGFSPRKGYDLIQISKVWTKILPPDDLEDTAAIGWSKMKILCPVINDENIKDWEALATNLTFRQLVEQVQRNKKDDKESIAEEAKEESKRYTFVQKGEMIKMADRALEIAQQMTDNDNPAYLFHCICTEFVATYEPQVTPQENPSAEIVTNLQ
jgi:hypothetical protein